MANMTNQKGKNMNKREKMKQIRDAQKALAKQLENDDRVDNPNLKKGRRSHSEIFNNIDTKSPKI